MKKSIVLHPGMGTAVIEHLRQFADLPRDGILAGQAVDSAITDLFGNGGGVYNDIDVFRRETEPHKNFNRRRANALTNRFEINASVGDPSYYGMGALLEVVQSYGIHSVKREGMLNTVNCLLMDTRKTLSAQRVLRGFDINCTRVAVDLATGQLEWDRNYEEFVHSRQLRITMMHTPWHTFLRLAKKAEELPSVYVDFDVAAESCVAIARSTWLNQMLKRKGVSLQFGQKHRELADRFESIWRPYFNMEEKRLYRDRHNAWTTDAERAHDGKFVDLCALTPRDFLDPKLQNKCNLMGNGLLFFAPRLIESSRRKASPAAYDKLNAIVALGEKLLEIPGISDVTTDAISDLPPRRMDFVQVHTELFGTDYVKGQALPTLATKVAEWVSQHRGLGPALVGLSLSEQYARMQIITEVCRKFGKQYFNGDSKAGFGILETQRDSALFESAEAMEKALLEYYRENSVPFDVKPLSLPTFVPARFAGFTVQELLTPHALRQEGTLMGHCVGGYSNAVRQGRSRILAIRYRDERRTENCSTVELQGSFDKPGSELKVIQNFSVSNTRPSAANQEFVKYLQVYLSSMVDIVPACERPEPRETAQRLLQEARKYEFLTRKLKFSLSPLQEKVKKLQAENHWSYDKVRLDAIEKLKAAERQLEMARSAASLLRELALDRLATLQQKALRMPLAPASFAGVTKPRARVVRVGETLREAA